MVNDNVIEEFVQSIQQTPTSTEDVYSAIVSRVDNEGVVWVRIAGSDKETPTAFISTEVSVGDYVNVQCRNNKLYIAGNYSNPSAGTVRVEAVEAYAQIANQAAQNAVTDAGRAREAAEDAIITAESIHDMAEDAKTSAESAEESAKSAKDSADTALDQLGIVENVVGVLDLISKHGNYQLTDDTEVVPDKWYFTRSGTSPNYVYTVVTDPSGDPNAQGWYEVTGIDEAIQNYVSSQLVVDTDGLWLQTAGVQSKVLLSATDGVVLFGANGRVVGRYGSTAQIGDSNYFHIEMDGTELGFYDGVNKVAYISNQQLYITQSVVLEQMDLGRTVLDGGLGQWSWKLHKNANGQNNLNLKWIG